MNTKIRDIAARIQGLRELMEISPEEMAKVTGITADEYLLLESGEKDFSFTFIYKCAERFGVDMVEILKGTSPTLSSYSVVRAGEGLPITRRAGFEYRHLAPFFKGKLAEPFIVTAPFSESEQNEDIPLATHEGQEIDIILNGSLKVQIDEHIEILNPGDAIYYDSGHKHGMTATGNDKCEFIAIVLKKGE